MINFDVMDRNGEMIGRVRDVNVDRTCILLETDRGSLFGRKQRYAVHIWAVMEIDSHTFKISLSATREDVADAPEFRAFGGQAETALARYYLDRLAASGERAQPDDG